MKASINKLASEFKCLQADCPDTCCKGWSMQLDDQTFAKYKGTNLEDAISYDGQNQEIRVMKRDVNTDFCVKFQDGICAIHKDKGDSWLGDACNFYPRVTRNFGDAVIMTATLSCPEVARIALESNDIQQYQDADLERVPNTLKTYDGSLKIHDAFLAACKEDITAEKLLGRILIACESLDLINKKDWPDAASFMIRMADGKMPKPEPEPMADLFILQIFCGIFHSTKKKMNPRLQAIMENIENYLGYKINWETLELSPAQSIRQNPQNHDITLNKYLLSQILFNTFPLGGLGQSLRDKAVLLIYKFALIRLALHASPNANPVDIIQPISRVIDHIGNPDLIFSLLKTLKLDSSSKLLGLLPSSHRSS